MEAAFNSDLYLTAQYERIQQKISTWSGHPAYIEFGGKPGDDHHAARVLPGYRPDAKIELLQSLMPSFTIAMVVNARDILLPPQGRYLKGRVRGDSGLLYGEETVRLIDWLGEKGLKPHAVVLSVTPRVLSDQDAEVIGRFEEAVRDRGIDSLRHYHIDCYPEPVIFENEESFVMNDPITQGSQNLVIFSPGGGSGKFGVVLSELYFALNRGLVPTFIKFETFPVFNLPARHPLNLAFEAATADLGNSVQQIAFNDRTVTTYDKDIENFRLLKELYNRHCKDRCHPILSMTHPTDMGVNVIESGITDMDAVIRACKFEVLRRLRRYSREVRKGLEKESTVDRARKIWMEAKSF